MLLHSQASHHPQIIHLPLSMVQKFRAWAGSTWLAHTHTEPHPPAGTGDPRSQCGPRLGSVALVGVAGGTSISSATRCGSRAQLEAPTRLRPRSRGSLGYPRHRIRTEQLGRSRRNDMDGLGTTPKWPSYGAKCISMESHWCSTAVDSEHNNATLGAPTDSPFPPRISALHSHRQHK